MEGKTVILSVLIISLVMAQIQVGAAIVCCKTKDESKTYNSCRILGKKIEVCISATECKMFSKKCDDEYPFPTVDQSGGSVNEYCKLGCTSSVCGAMTTLQKSDASEIMNGAVEQCTKGCSTLCTEGIKTVLETA